MFTLFIIFQKLFLIERANDSLRDCVHKWDAKDVSYVEYREHSIRHSKLMLLQCRLFFIYMVISFILGGVISFLLFR